MVAITNIYAAGLYGVSSVSAPLTVTRREGSGHARQRGLCLWYRGIWSLSVGIRKAVWLDAAWAQLIIRWTGRGVFIL